MCQSKDTDICTGDCNDCAGPALHAPDVHKRFETLTRTISDPEQEMISKPICSTH